MENQTRIVLRTAEDALHFVNEASKCDFDIDVFYNRIIIDAKSVIGVMSMDLSNILTVKCHGHSDQFSQVLSKYAVV